MNTFRIGLLIACIAFVSRATAAPSENPPLSDGIITELIQKLGAPDYLTRESAQRELKRIGLDAFDAIFEATMHEDIEIARRARYLLKSSPIRWQADMDPSKVKEVLRAYPAGTVSDRRTLMDRLARLPNGQGIEALCRLARFETEHVLSKHAALLIMSSDAQLLDSTDVATRIRETLGKSRRIACNWLRVYARTLEAPVEMLSVWDKLFRDEQEVFSQHPERTDQKVMRDLMRWYADLLHKHDRAAESVAVIRRSFDVLRGEPDDLIDASNWLLSRQLWNLVEELSKRHSNRFDDSLELLYILAESQLRQDKVDVANQTADHARALEATPYAHVRQARELHERGLIKWCEKEYLRVFELTPKAESADLQARSGLTELYHDQERHREAGEVWKELFDASEKDRALGEQLAKNFDPRPVKARMHYYFALHHRDQQEFDKERERLEKGIAELPGELDILIAMHRIRYPDDAWTKKTTDLIKATVGQLEETIANQEKYLVQNPHEQYSDTRIELAQKCNEYAWLVANTEGDFDLALQRSQRSLQLSPGSAAYLDTLGRCFYSVKKFDEAIKYQQQALSSEPHSGQMRRQLEFFVSERERDAARK